MHIQHIDSVFISKNNICECIYSPLITLMCLNNCLVNAVLRWAFQIVYKFTFKYSNQYLQHVLSLFCDKWNVQIVLKRHFYS